MSSIVTRARLDFDCPACGTLIMLRDKQFGFIESKEKGYVEHHHVCPLCYVTMTMRINYGYEVDKKADTPEKKVGTTKRDPARKKALEKVLTEKTGVKVGTIKRTKVINPQDGSPRKVIKPDGK
jgi:predicted RNA-binding Zn-ribbon protein involved in translation (DUF1610 family)